MEQRWSLPKQRVIEDLKTNPHHGLSSTEVRRRLRLHGLNELKGKDGPTGLEILLRQLKSPLIYILLLAAAFAIFQNHFTDAIVILLVVVFNTAIGYFQEHKAEKTMARLRQILAPQARVIRESVEQKIEAKYLVAGDIIKIEAGDRVPADARLLECQGLRINQAALTGESVPAHKRDSVISPKTALIDRTNMVYMSTLVATGQAVAVVVGTGMNTELGLITREVSEVKERPESLDRDIARLGRILLVLGLVFSVGTFLIGIYRGINASEMLTTTISLLVSVVPEGLPVAVTVALSIGLLRVYRKKAIIRKLSAAETLGSVTTICVDKTGTITEGKMMVEKLLVPGEEITVTGDGYRLSGDFMVDGKRIDMHKHRSARFLLELVSLATTSTINRADLRKDEAKQLTDPTETALAVVAAKAGYYAFKQESDHPEILEIPFDQEARYSTSVHTYERGNRYIVKGAPEKILKLSTHVQSNGVARRLLKATHEKLEETARQYAAEGYRVTALGYADRPKSVRVGADQVKSLTFVGFLCMTDPIRRDVDSAINEAKQAGMQVMMITGDHLLTAESIGKRVGLLISKKAVHADEIHRQDLSQIGVVARATPSQKLKIVDRLQQHGQIVAMTGDGVNDAPALKKADIGIAMGKGGTDVAAEAADMVLLDDRFGAIVEAVRQGRLIWENLRKAVYYLISTSLAEIAILVVALLLGMPLPLLAVQILWMNFVTDGITSLALTVEPEEESLMKRPPRDPKSGLIDAAMGRRMIAQSSVMTVGTLLLFQAYLGSGHEYARTVALTVMVFYQLFNIFNARSATQSVFSVPLRRNPLLLGMFAFSVVLQVLVVYHPLLQQLLGTTSLDVGTFMVTIVVATTSIWLDEIRKLAIRLAKAWALSQQPST